MVQSSLQFADYRNFRRIYQATIFTGVWSLLLLNFRIHQVSFSLIEKVPQFWQNFEEVLIFISAFLCLSHSYDFCFFFRDSPDSLYNLADLFSSLSKLVQIPAAVVWFDLSRTQRVSKNWTHYLKFIRPRMSDGSAITISRFNILAAPFPS